MKTFTTIATGGLVTTVAAAGTWLSGQDPHRAFIGPPGAAGWAAAVHAGAPGVPAPDLGELSPARAARFFARLSPAARAALTRRAPGVVGNLDGVPYRLRYAANQRSARADAAARGAPGRLLAYDPRGDGRIAEVFGDLAAARRVVVIIPGSGWTLHKILTAPRATPANPVAGARALLAELRRQAPAVPVAVVAWLGYDAPEHVDREAARSGRAIAGAVALDRLVAGLPGHGTVTLVGHSYGTVVAGRAAASSARVTDVVALASPGMDADSVAGLHTRARVWAARVPGDPIAYTPHLRLGRYGHGADPVAAGFGALVFRTGSAHGHGGYYAPGSESLVNIARIALGRTAEVTRAHDG
ncbi:MAG TPA: alpha/beta hydrolase [Streptosporangiaceae bacterium]